MTPQEELKRLRERLRMELSGQQAPEPTRWQDEFWPSLLEVYRNTPAGRFFTKEFWSKTGRNLLTQTAEMVASETVTPIGKQRALIEKGLMAYKAFRGEEMLPTVPEEAGSYLKAGMGVLLFIPKTLVGLAKDPAKTIQEDPLSVLMLTGLIAGPKIARKIRTKQATKGWVTTGDLFNPLRASAKLSPTLRNILKDVPANLRVSLDRPKPPEPLIIVKQTKPGAVPIFKHEFDPLLGIKDLPPRKIKYYYENPIRVFEDFPTLKRDIYNPMKIAEDAIARDLPLMKKNVHQMRKTTDKGASKRLGIHSIAQQKKGIENLRASGIKDIPKLPPAELKVYNAVRTNLEGVYVQINKARALAGRSPLPKVENYFTFARGLETLKELGHNPIFERDTGFLNYHLNAPSFKYANRRRGIIAPVELDFFRIYTDYMASALDFIHKAPVIAKGRALIGDYPKQKFSFRAKNPRLHTYMTEWLDYNAGQKPPTIAPEWLTQASRTLNRNIGMGVLTFNFRSAMIQPTAWRGAYIELGSRWLAEGIVGNFNPQFRALAQRHGIGSRRMDIHVAEMQAGNIKRGVGRVRQVAGKIGISGLQYLDIETARSTWIGAYKRAKTPTAQGGMGLAEADAIIYARDTVTKTQASALRSDLAPIQRTALGRLATIFQTFVINEWNYLSKDVLGWKNPRMVNSQRATKIARLVWSTALINALFEGVFKIRSPYPAPEWAIIQALEQDKEPLEIAGAVVKELGEQIPVIGGSIRWSTPYRTAWPAPIRVAEGASKIIDKMLRGKAPIAIQDLETIALLLGLPGTSQARKYWSRRKQGMSHLQAIIGVRTDVARKKKYKVPR